jgi:predicted enzyme related to lactoylglutathione lyase
MTNATPKLFRVTIEVDDLERGAAFYSALLETGGRRHPGARHYFDCGGVILAVQDVSRGGLSPHANAKSLYFAVDDLEAVHSRAAALGALAPYRVHEAPAGEIAVRPWHERSFYAVDPWENDLCFVAEGTLYT